jgi:hypothetical protein
VLAFCLMISVDAISVAIVLAFFLMVSVAIVLSCYNVVRIRTLVSNWPVT